MRCEEVRELLPAYLDAEPHEARAIDAHLVTCEACSAVLTSYRSMQTSLAALPNGDPAPPTGLVARAIAQIPERSTVERLRVAAREHPIAAAAGIGGATIAAFAAVYALRRSRRASLAVVEVSA